MFRTSLFAAVTAFTIAAAAPANAANCISNYEDFWEKISGDAKIAPETLVSINRTALRAFDACQSGDEGDFGAGFWEKMSLYGEVKDVEKFWEEMSLYGGAKK
ncbi:MAG: hypothetical protein AAFR75_07730 [Pseudomonadota bacterium]